MLLQKESNVSGCFCLSPGGDGLNGLMPEPPEGMGEVGFAGMTGGG